MGMVAFTELSSHEPRATSEAVRNAGMPEVFKPGTDLEACHHWSPLVARRGGVGE
jgi:hypothetical protein